MNFLYLDVGNSRTKIAVFEESHWKVIKVFDRRQKKELIQMIKDSNSIYDKILVSCVVKSVKDELVEVCPNNKLFLFSNSDIPPNLISYESASTMGVDRFIASYGAWSLQGKSACIVVDAGTACTIDYMDANGIYQGGVIMPGLKTLEDGLLLSAQALPPAERFVPDEWPPKTTMTALQWGILGSFLAAIEAHVWRFLDINKKAGIWVTGGDASLIHPLLKLKTEINEKLVFQGLHSLYLRRNSSR
ncbi:MAG: type III pantothenate kinase [Balneolales bacterium]